MSQVKPHKTQLSLIFSKKRALRRRRAAAHWADDRQTAGGYFWGVEELLGQLHKKLLLVQSGATTHLPISLPLIQYFKNFLHCFHWCATNEFQPFYQNVDPSKYWLQIHRQFNMSKYIKVTTEGSAIFLLSYYIAIINCQFWKVV